MAKNDHQYHQPDAPSIYKIQALRKGTISLEETILDNCPDDDKRRQALEHLNLARMLAIQSIVVECPTQE